MKKAFVLLAFVFLGCASNSPTNSAGGEDSHGIAPREVADYPSIINIWTQREQSYNNFAQTFQVTSTLLSRDVVEGQIALDAERYNWSSPQTQEARQKALYDLQSQTSFFVSLYTDKDEDNNLDKSSTVWNLFIDVNGKRVLPKEVKRVYENKVVIQQKYPYLNVWSRNYFVRFPISTDEVANNGVQFTLAGPLGNAHLRYSKK